jgi:hypothetical protein
MLERELPLSMGVGEDTVGSLGSKVTSPPDLSTTVHWLADGHATPLTPDSDEAITVGVAVLGDAGSNVTSVPVSSTTVHWLADGHATPFVPGMSKS